MLIKNSAITNKKIDGILIEPSKKKVAVMKKNILLSISFIVSLLFLTGFSSDHYGKGRVYVCTLAPFTDIFADVARTEDYARYKVQKRCEKDKGEGSLFCKAQEAKCTISSIELTLLD